MSDFVPSHFQQAIYDHVVAQWAALKAWRKSPADSLPPRNLIVRATAGSGKSSTLRTVCALIPDARIDVVSFSARVAKDAEKRLPPNASSVTLHAVGKRALEAFFGRKYRSGSERRGNDAELDGRKSQRIIAALKERGAISQYVPAAALAKLVSKAKGVGIVPMVMDSQSRATVGSQGWTCTPLCEDTDAAWQALCAHHQIEASDERKLIDAARIVLTESLKCSTALIDFDDMVYLAAILDAVTFERRDVVMVDELQDLDAMQRRMVLRMCGNMDNGRGVLDGAVMPTHTALFIGVGDPRQAI